MRQLKKTVNTYIIRTVSQFSRVARFENEMERIGRESVPFSIVPTGWEIGKTRVNHRSH